MLPHEKEVMAAIAVEYRVQCDRMSELHNAVVSMMTAGSWTVRNQRGLAPFVANTMMGLLTKACKTFRAIEILIERGLHEDASSLVRVLMETTIAIAFILQKKSKERELIYHAYGMAQKVKMLNDWASTRGLKRKASKAKLKQMTDAIADSLRRLPPGTEVKHHWSGKASLQAAMRELRNDVTYATLYRHTSSISHVSDFGAHFQLDADGEFIWEVEPQVQGFELPSYAARELLWNAANRIDQRLGLGFAATLSPHKVTRAEVREGRR